MTRAEPEPERILLIQLHHLGDVLLATPALRAARARFPRARIDFLTGPLGAQALAGNPHLDNVLTAPRSLWKSLSVFRELRRTRYDAVADMHSVPRSARFVAATGARMRIGLRGRGPRNWAYTQLLPREQRAVYMALQKLRVLAPLGIDAEQADLSLEICLSEAERAWAHETLRAVGLADRDTVVAVSPVARHEFKQWGAARWAAAAAALAATGARILITSGPGEQEQARAVAKQMQHPAIWQYPPTTVRQLAALYERCVLWIGNDGGPKHVAVAAGTPTVSVVRRELGGVWNDLRPESKQVALSSGSDSLDTITPDQVVRAATQFLTGRSVV